MLSQLSYTPTYSYAKFFFGAPEKRQLFGDKEQQRSVASIYVFGKCELSEVCCDVVGLSGLEPPTSRLSGVRSNHLSYKPIIREALASSISFLNPQK